ncbi:unnamed protein product [Moneuplotes crassus]|uniref:Uncharacterized protein n=1 Tax=Euplotes crassus TaxID=5936 RepID=A0AAD1X547_EUPCR|nr:unnamed protein product [Moneuplotes crassus]
MNSSIYSSGTVFTFRDFDEANISDEISSEGSSTLFQVRETVGARSMGSSPFSKSKNDFGNEHLLAMNDQRIFKTNANDADKNSYDKENDLRHKSATQRDISDLLKKLAKQRKMASLN